MREKRYFKIEYGEEWYLFDSTTISEQLVKEQAEYDYGVFANSLSPSEICDLLNNLHQENEQLRLELETHKHPLWSTREAERKINKLSNSLADEIKKNGLLNEKVNQLRIENMRLKKKGGEWCMSESKRFEITEYGSDYYIEIIDNEKEPDESIDNPSQKLGLVECVDLLNEQQATIQRFEEYVFSDERILCYNCLFCQEKDIYEVKCKIKGSVDVHGKCQYYEKKR